MIKFNSTSAQSRLHTALRFLALITLWGWAVWPAFADWYASVGSAVPNSATGQTGFIKGLHAVGYGTPQEAEWFSILPMGLFTTLLLVALASQKSGYNEGCRANGKRPWGSLIFWLIWFAIVAGGGHWISLAITGSWSLPNHHQV